MSNYHLRLNYREIAGFGGGAPILSNVYASRALCLKWFEKRLIPLPPWLKQPVVAPIEGAAVETSAVQQPVIVQQPMIEGTAQPNKKTNKLPPFNVKKAMVLFVAEKTSGNWREAPTEEESIIYLKRHFNGVPNDPHRKLRRKVWGEQIRPGPRRKSVAAD